MKSSIIPLFNLLLCRLVSSQVDPTQDYYVGVAGENSLFLPENLDFIVVTACGASGGGDYGGGAGGCITTKLSSPDVFSGALLHFKVGGVGGSCSQYTCVAPGGYNGGGDGTNNYLYAGLGFGGGGMTTLYNGNTLLLVAGGGGGQGAGGVGGAGGAAGTAGKCSYTGTPQPVGGCQAGGYYYGCSTLSLSGASNVPASLGGGGGGGGYFGGGSVSYCGGGGGSNYARGIQNSFSNPGTTKSGYLKIHFSVHPSFQPTLQPVSAAPSFPPPTMAPTRLPPGSSPYYYFTMINVSSHVYFLSI
jgi:hypothetical protein